MGSCTSKQVENIEGNMLRGELVDPEKSGDIYVLLHQVEVVLINPNANKLTFLWWWM
jgi:hypothetical protein